jgi:hypothetical protein
MVPEGSTFEPTDEQEPVPERRFVKEDWPSPRRRAEREYDSSDRGTLPGWETTRAGLGLISIALNIILYTLLGYLALTLVSVVLALAGAGMGAGMGLVIGHCVVLVAGVLFLVAGILYFIGQCMCCAVPAESGGKGLAITSLLCLILLLAGVGIGVAYLVLSLRRDEIPSNSLVNGATLGLGLLGLVGHGSFVLFLRAVANFFGNSRLAAYALAYLCCYVVLTLAHWAGSFLLQAMPRLQQQQFAGALSILVLLAFVILAVVLLAVFLWLVVAVRKTIGREYRGR